jgi:hypothetical protein
MNVEIGTEAAQFPEKEYINGIFLAVQTSGQISQDDVNGFSSTSEGCFMAPGVPDAGNGEPGSEAQGYLGTI